VGALLELQPPRDLLAAEARTRLLGEEVEQRARRRRELPVEPRCDLAVLGRPRLRVLAAAAVPAAGTAPASRGWCPRLGGEEGREPRVELGHALLGNADGDLLVGHAGPQTSVTAGVASTVVWVSCWASVVSA